MFNSHFVLSKLETIELYAQIKLPLFIASWSSELTLCC